MLAFSIRTLKSSGVPARRVQAGGFCVGMLSLVCSTPACPGLLVVVRFRAVHRCCFFGVLLSSQQGSPFGLSALCWLALGEREGLSEHRSLGCFVLRVLPGVGGSEAGCDGETPFVVVCGLIDFPQPRKSCLWGCPDHIHRTRKSHVCKAQHCHSTSFCWTLAALWQT